jgi:hypothetical protein
LPLIVTLAADDLLRNGPIVKIRIGNPSDPSKTAMVAALVDTGAAFTAINPQLAQSCQLIQRGQKKIRVLGNTKLQDAKEYPDLLHPSASQEVIYVILGRTEWLLVRFSRHNSLA